MEQTEVMALEAKPLLTMSGRGKELSNMLRAELGVPKRVQSFSVHFNMDDVVRVECKYIPEASDA